MSSSLEATPLTLARPKSDHYQSTLTKIINLTTSRARGRNKRSYLLVDGSEFMNPAEEVDLNEWSEIIKKVFADEFLSYAKRRAGLALSRLPQLRPLEFFGTRSIRTQPRDFLAALVYTHGQPCSLQQRVSALPTDPTPTLKRAAIMPSPNTSADAIENGHTTEDSVTLRKGESGVLLTPRRGAKRAKANGIIEGENKVVDMDMPEAVKLEVNFSPSQLDEFVGRVVRQIQEFAGKHKQDGMSVHFRTRPMLPSEAPASPSADLQAELDSPGRSIAELQARQDSLRWRVAEEETGLQQQQQQQQPLPEISYPAQPTYFPPPTAYGSPYPFMPQAQMARYGEFRDYSPHQTDQFLNVQPSNIQLFNPQPSTSSLPSVQPSNSQSFDSPSTTSSFPNIKHSPGSPRQRLQPSGQNRGHFDIWEIDQTKEPTPERLSAGSTDILLGHSCQSQHSDGYHMTL
ncbi:hypothetical protein AYL99_11693 [Fonsecaea erecta]|uniref:Uncharacterized protein n=1 Tax=Fonsecaea erecta TaxID=1367422 RepID=A0A178Z2X3_9EURO|nr:hypothetical protein AYL99_11693 [Fonsecaea erecta]OAP54158.1 hypothetical protein AYL99_11693 [Fonsecaea erecta]